MSAKSDFFKETESSALAFFKSVESHQPPLEEMIGLIKAKRPDFKREGDSLWGIIKEEPSNYHVWVTKDDLSIWRGKLHDHKSRVAYYNEPDKVYPFFIELGEKDNTS